MVDSNSNNLRDVMKADISLGNSGASNCWTRQMKDAFGDLQNGTVYRSDLFQCRKLNISNLRIDLFSLVWITKAFNLEWLLNL